MRTSLAFVVAAVLLAAGCSDDDNAAADTSAVVDTVTEAPTTSPPSTVPPTTLPPSTTVAPSTTISDDQLKAVIAADYEAVVQAAFAGLLDPSLDALPALLTATVVPGSPAEQSFSANVQHLVELGDAIVPGDPDIMKVTVENVELVGDRPYTMALVTTCEAENRRQVTLAKNSGIGSDVETPGSGDLQATRFVHDVRLTPNGWRLYETQEGTGFVYPGTDTCPPQ